jgi:hypothetical protein
MKSLKNWARRQARTFILSLIKLDLVEVRREASKGALDKCNDQLSALQALDVRFQETGKIVLVARVGKQDLVKIIETPPNWTADVWHDTVRELESRYGARPRFQDLPRGFERGRFQ